MVRRSTRLFTEPWPSASLTKTPIQRVLSIVDRQLNTSAEHGGPHPHANQPRNRAYTERRLVEGKTSKEIRRSLTLYTSQRIFRRLTTTHPDRADSVRRANMHSAAGHDIETSLGHVKATDGECSRPRQHRFNVSTMLHRDNGSRREDLGSLFSTCHFPTKRLTTMQFRMKRSVVSDDPATVTTWRRQYRRKLRHWPRVLATVAIAAGLALGVGAVSSAPAFAGEHQGTERTGSAHPQALAGP